MVIDERPGASRGFCYTVTWSVNGVTIHFTERGVGVPLDANLDDPQIIDALKTAQRMHKRVEAVELLSDMSGGQLEDNYISRAPDDYMDELLERIALVTEPSDIALPSHVQDTIGIIRAEHERRIQQAIGRASKKKKRGQVSSKYERLFFVVGQRDGFKCAQCGTVEVLQIDHIVPLNLNGSNDLDNLQLLCRKHNLEKGTSVVDFRQKA